MVSTLIGVAYRRYVANAAKVVTLTMLAVLVMAEISCSESGETTMANNHQFKRPGNMSGRVDICGKFSCRYAAWAWSCAPSRRDRVKSTDAYEVETANSIFQAFRRWPTEGDHPDLGISATPGSAVFCEKDRRIEREIASLLLIWRSVFVQKRDRWNRPFRFVTDTSYEYIEVFSLGADGLPYTGDDLALCLDVKYIATESWLSCAAKSTKSDCSGVRGWTDYWKHQIICRPADPETPDKTRLLSAGPDGIFDTADDIGVDF